MFSMHSQRGVEMRVLDNFKYKKAHVTATGRVWRCSHNSCNVSFLTDLEGTTILKEPNGVHTHAEEAKLSRQFLTNSVKRKQTEDDSQRPKKLVYKEVKDLPTYIADNLKRTDLHNAARSITRKRRAKHAAMPGCMKDVQEALKKMDLICREENFLLVNDVQNHVVVFGTVTNLRYLCKREKIFMDGTFEYCTAHFKQMFTIHSIENDNYVPLLFCLLPNKQTRLYKILLDHIIRLCLDIDETFYPETIVVDFELGIHEALRNTWRSVIINGCRFHLAQSWWRKIQELGLVPIYKDKTSEAGSILRWCFGLSLLDSAEIEDAFTDDLMARAPKEIFSFCDYLLETYITENSLFPPRMWASNSLKSDRTTNACEGFHSQFGEFFNVSHPNIFIFANVLLSYQHVIYILMRSAAIEPRVNYRTDFHRRQHELELNLYNYRRKIIDRYTFVKTASYFYRKRR